MVNKKANANGYLRRIFSDTRIIIPATSGKENIVHATDVFTGRIDSDFEKKYGCDVGEEPTVETVVEMFEIVRDGCFTQFLGNFKGVGPDQLCLSQHQIKAFVKDHKHRLRTDLYETFFLFKAHGEFFIAEVSLYSDGKIVVVGSYFSDPYEWDAEDLHRLVVPQLEHVTV